jgi:hypothetical protein
VVGDHELGLQFPDGIYDADDYVARCSDASWVAFGAGFTPDEQAAFLNRLCMDVSGYVGESVFAEPDSMLFFTGPGWHRVGRSELVRAASKCEAFAGTFNIPVPLVLEACMEVVDTTLRKYQDVADRMFRVLLEGRRLDGYRFAALLAAIKEEDLSLAVRKRLGIEMGESS